LVVYRVQVGKTVLLVHLAYRVAREKKAYEARKVTWVSRGREEREEDVVSRVPTVTSAEQVFLEDLVRREFT
jgi:KaiC/GvpD/RAD55 family RecA-like ATPase